MAEATSTRKKIKGVGLFPGEGAREVVRERFNRRAIIFKKNLDVTKEKGRPLL